MILSNSIPFSSDAKRRVKNHEFVGVDSPWSRRKNGCSVQPGSWLVSLGVQDENGRLLAGSQRESSSPNSKVFQSNECPKKSKLGIWGSFHHYFSTTVNLIRKFSDQDLSNFLRLTFPDRNVRWGQAALCSSSLWAEQCMCCHAGAKSLVGAVGFLVKGPVKG